ncbi:MAG: YncE family protein [bacterium]
MKRFVLLLFFGSAVILSSCSTSTPTQTTFTYPYSMTLGYLPVSNTRTLFVANMFTGTVSEINTLTNSVLPITTQTRVYSAIPLNIYPNALEYNNGYLYIAGFTQATGFLESMDLLTNQTTCTVALKGFPLKAQLISSTSMLYVIDVNGNNFYLQSFNVSSTITPFTYTSIYFTPSDMTVTPDKRNIIVSYQNQPFISIIDPVTLEEVKRVPTDHPVTVMHALNNYSTMLYAIVMSGTSFNFESINLNSGNTGYEFTLPGVPYDMAITPQRVILDDNHFSYLGIIANANGYVHFINIDYGCEIPAIPSSHSGVTLTTSISSPNLPSIPVINTNDCTTQTETWSVIYNATRKDYSVIGTVSGLQPMPAMNGSFFDANNDAVSFYIEPGSIELNNNDMFTFSTSSAQQIKTILGLGLPQHIIIDQVSNQAYVTDILTNSIYVISPATQSIITTLR